MRQRNAVVIDDEPDVTTYLATLLSDHGWRVRTANGVDQGLKLLASERPDAVLLDLMMPERGGLAALVAIRKDPSLAGLPVIIVSGIQEKLTSDYHAFLERAKHYKADAYLDKPVVPAELLRTLDALVTASV
jgi:two-component system alkaline phosphatase synthesis response regulator PhoP